MYSFEHTVVHGLYIHLETATRHLGWGMYILMRTRHPSTAKRSLPSSKSTHCIRTSVLCTPSPHPALHPYACTSTYPRSLSLPNSVPAPPPFHLSEPSSLPPASSIHLPSARSSSPFHTTCFTPRFAPVPPFIVRPSRHPPTYLVNRPHLHTYMLGLNRESCMRLVGVAYHV